MDVVLAAKMYVKGAVTLRAFDPACLSIQNTKFIIQNHVSIDDSFLEEFCV